MCPETDSWETTSRFLVAEYEQFWAGFRANEESGERRVSLFLTIASAAVALTGVAAEAGLNAEQLSRPAAVLLGGLTVIGLATLFRLVKRNVVSDEYKVAMDSIRAVFRYWDGEVLADYNPFVRLRQIRADRGGGRKLWGILPVGLVLLVSAINAALATGVLIALWDIKFEHLDRLFSSVAFFFAFAAIQLLAADKAEESLKGGKPRTGNTEQDPGTGALSLGAPELGDRYKNGGIR